MPRLLLVLACLLLPALSLQAETFRAVVSHVTDGDTIWVRRAGQREAIEIRLLDLDAPENCQAFGPQAKAALRARILRQPVVVRTRGHDTYQRTLAQVRFHHRDVGAWLVREGHAWSSTFQGRRGPYARLEEQARRARRGLWSAPGAMEPRHFRHHHGRCE